MTDRIAARFLRFAEREADGSSALYAALARGVAGDPFAAMSAARRATGRRPARRSNPIKSRSLR
jgi:hypothetical protein